MYLTDAPGMYDYSIEVLDGLHRRRTTGDTGRHQRPRHGLPGQFLPVLPYRWVPGATIYTWSITPAGMGTVTGSGPNIGAGLECQCQQAGQHWPERSQCVLSQPDSKLHHHRHHPSPTAMIAGSGVMCAGAMGSVPLTVNFTGQAPWQFVYTINGAPQPAIQTSDNPYILMATPAWHLRYSERFFGERTPGHASENAVITQTTITANAQVTNAQCGCKATAPSTSWQVAVPVPYTLVWSGGQMTEDSLASRRQLHRHSYRCQRPHQRRGCGCQRQYSQPQYHR
ncbi:MAG: hypothetical protein IPK76_17610 [Lewinellaceae bacterium]|nr:hypothetical protein [Lewinellaceae bacterium]